MNKSTIEIYNKNQSNHKELGRNELVSFFDFLSRNKIIISLFSGTTFFFSIFLALISERIWEGEFQIVLAQDKSIENNLTMFDEKRINFRNFNTSSNGLRTQVEILKSPYVLMPIFEYLNERKSSNSAIKINSTFKDWRDKNLKLELERGTNVLNISFRDSDKNLILNVLNQISVAYQGYALTKRMENINDGINYLNKQVLNYEIKSKNSYQRAIDFAIENDLKPDLNLNTNNINTELSRIKAEDKILKINQILKRLDELKDSNEEIKFIGQSIVDSDMCLYPFQTIIDEINNIEDYLTQSRLNFKENDPRIKKLIIQRDVNLKILKQKIYGLLNEKAKIAAITLESSKRPKEIIFEYKQLIRESQRDDAILNEIINERNLLALEKAKQKRPWDLITKPTLNKNPVAPQRKKMAFIGFLFGLGLGSIICFCKELLEDIAFDEDTITNILNIPIQILLKLPNVSDWEEPLVLYAKKISNKKENQINLNIIKIGDVENKNYNFIKNKLEKQIDKKNFNLNFKLSDINQNSKQIFIIQLGKCKLKEIKKLKQLLEIKYNLNNEIIIIKNNKFQYKFDDYKNFILNYKNFFNSF